MTYREAVYMCLDEVKIHSDDSTFTEDHILFLLDKYRAHFLVQKYTNVKNQIPASNYQEICLNLTETSAIPGDYCLGTYLRSVEKVPFLLRIGINRVYAPDYFNSEITLVNKERFKYVGTNKYLQNIIYCTIGPDNHLYFKSSNPQFLYLEQVRMNAVFQDSQKVSVLSCEDSDTVCDVLDKEFPLEESLAPTVINAVVRELLGATWRPKDDINNANDDLSDLANFLIRNTKTNIQKQIEGDV